MKASRCGLAGKELGTRGTNGLSPERAREAGKPHPEGQWAQSREALDLGQERGIEKVRAVWTLGS